MSTTDLINSDRAASYIRRNAVYGDSIRQIWLYNDAIQNLEGAIGMSESNGWTDREIGFRGAVGVIKLERLRMRQRLGLHA